MKNTLINILMLATGAAIGSVVTWKLVKKKYERIANEEIESVKETFAKREKNKNIGIDLPKADDIPVNDQKPIRKTIQDKPDLMEYAAKIREEGYMDYTNQSKPEKKEPYTRDMDDFTYDEEPYVIAPEHFDEYDDYEAESLTYWKNGYLTDEDGNLIEDIAGMVGEDYADHFGEFEDDSVFIRNERLKTDFEILAVEYDYTEDPMEV